MLLHFEPVTKNNQEAILALKIKNSQKGYIENVKECLEEAASDSAWRTVGIYVGTELVGFSMYGCFQDAGKPAQLWLDRLLIDARFQEMGYGTAALSGLADLLFTEYPHQQIFLSVYEINKAAIHLYKKFGFHFTGEIDTKGEKIMVYSL